MSLLLALQVGLAALSLALLTLFPSGKGAVMFFAGSDAAVRIVVAADGLVMSANGRWTVATSERPDFAKRLYAAGATLVVAAPFTGLCRSRSAKETNR